MKDKQQKKITQRHYELIKVIWMRLRVLREMKLLHMTMITNIIKDGLDMMLDS